MRRGTRFQLAIVLMLVGAFASAAMAQTALAQTTGATGATGGDDGEKVVFTWGTAGETSSLNPMSGYLATDFYFWTPQYHLLIDWAAKDFSAE
ncbi:MAG TPA: hypothetical protein VFV29_04805, partial [Actinomycetota bacterium]|nr:hypothetical protein [Actinomycetota bacterium]